MEAIQIILSIVFLAAFIYAAVLTLVGWMESKVHKAATKASIITGFRLLLRSLSAFRKGTKQKTTLVGIITLITVYPVTFFSILFNIPWTLTEFFYALAEATSM